MVFEGLISLKLAERKPIEMLPIAFFFSTVAIWLALWIFPGQAAIVAVFLTTLACTPIMLMLVRTEEKKEEHSRNYVRELLQDSFVRDKREHERVLPFFIFMFAGMSIAFTFWFAVLPEAMIRDLFSIQLGTIRQINSNVVGHAVNFNIFARILANNIKVLAFAIFFSFIYGAGAIFILAWNASVIGVAIGDTMRRAISSSAGTMGIKLIGYTSAASTSILRYMLHGIPEILAYFIGGLAGGIVSIALLKHDWKSSKFEGTMRDAFGLIGLSLIILIIAAVIEITLSPLIVVR